MPSADPAEDLKKGSGYTAYFFKRRHHHLDSVVSALYSPAPLGARGISAAACIPPASFLHPFLCHIPVSVPGTSSPRPSGHLLFFPVRSMPRFHVLPVIHALFPLCGGTGNLFLHIADGVYHCIGYDFIQIVKITCLQGILHCIPNVLAQVSP